MCSHLCLALGGLKSLAASIKILGKLLVPLCTLLMLYIQNVPLLFLLFFQYFGRNSEKPSVLGNLLRILCQYVSHAQEFEGLEHESNLLKVRFLEFNDKS